jgi:hypothetical protein
MSHTTTKRSEALSRRGFSDAAPDFKPKRTEKAMPDTLMFVATSKSPRVTNFSDGLEHQIASALSPLLVEDDVMGHRFAEGRAEIDAYRALLEICGCFTVADAVKASDIVCAARQPLWESGADPIRYGAFWEAFGIFESFIATARPSSADCVGELARHLAVFEEKGEQRMFEVLRPLAATTLSEGFTALRSNDFANGEQFRSGGDGTQGWCKRALEATGREAWWCPSVDGVRE